VVEESNQALKHGMGSVSSKDFLTIEEEHFTNQAGRSNKN
jgi:hypothetical protein